MNKSVKRIVLLSFTIALIWLAYNYSKKINFNRNHDVGDIIDSIDGVYVYYNGGVSNISGRNLSQDGYNLGMKYQCVEFVKRYYYQHYQHKMPDSYGNAKDFFNKSLTDSSFNDKRGLMQFTNGSKTKPTVGDLIIFDGTTFNKYGHIAIIVVANTDSIIIIQQNPGPFGKSRVSIPLSHHDNLWYVEKESSLGWLRKV